MSAATRIKLWATANGLDATTVTATCDGERVVEINGSRAYAAQAMAIPQEEVDAATAAERVTREQAPQDVAIGKVRLRTHADGAVELIDGPLILPGSASGAYEVWVDAETGLVLSTLDHASPRKSKAEKDAAKQAKRDQIAAVKAATNDKDRLAALLKLLGLAP